jgi:hypothetical protein
MTLASITANRKCEVYVKVFAKRILDLNALRRLPAVLEAERVAETERTQRRAELIRRIEGAKQEFESKDSALVKKAAPIEQELAKLRARVSQLEQDLHPLADARLTAIYLRNSTIKELQAELRADAIEELREFERVIESTRTRIQSDPDAVLAKFRVGGGDMNQRVVEALQLTLEAHNEGFRSTVTEGDIVAALNRVCDDLRTAGIKLESQH